MVFKAVEDFGEILAYNPSSQDIEDEKFDLDFSLVVASSQELQPIVDAIKAVSEIEGVDAKESSHEEFMQEEEPEAAPETKQEETKNMSASLLRHRRQPRQQRNLPSLLRQTTTSR